MTGTEALERRIDELCAEVERLRQDNAKLRGFWTHDGTWHVELPRLSEGIAVTTPDERDREVRTAMVWRYVREDEAENDRLRELVRDMRTCIDHACMCEFCPLFVTEEDMGERRCIADMKAHMRELGVEVDG